MVIHHDQPPSEVYVSRSAIFRVICDKFNYYELASYFQDNIFTYVVIRYVFVVIYGVQPHFDSYMWETTTF